MSKYKRIKDKKYIVPVSTILFHDKESKKKWNEKIERQRQSVINGNLQRDWCENNKLIKQYNKEFEFCRTHLRDI